MKGFGIRVFVALTGAAFLIGGALAGAAGGAALNWIDRKYSPEGDAGATEPQADPPPPEPAEPENAEEPPADSEAPAADDAADEAADGDPAPESDEEPPKE